jgi:hypothetical protein
VFGRISTYWSLQELSERKIHLLVCTTEDIAKLLPRKPRFPSSVADEKIRRLVDESIPRIEAKLARYLDSDAQLPSFEPEDGKAEMREYISSLRIPKLSLSPGSLSLLLHDLGNESHDPYLEKRIKELFPSDLGFRLVCSQ